MSHLRTALLALAAALLASGCGQDTVRSIPAEPGQPLLQVDRTGGFRVVGADFVSLPTLTVLPDGRAFSLGPVPAIYPGPALPNVRVHQLDEAQLMQLEDLARDAGLLAAPPDYGRSLVADATTTVLRLHVDGTSYEHQIYALGYEASPPGGRRPGAPDPSLPDVEQARDRVRQFLDAAQHMVASTGPGETYQPEAFAVRATPVDTATIEPEPVPAVRPWPLAGVDLAAAGDCQVVTGADGAALLPVLRAANELTRFEQTGVRYALAVRPLLPGDDGC